MNGEKYELLRSSVGVMISFKYLVAFCVMLLIGGNPAWAAAADDTTADAAATSTPAPKSHHKKHHTKTTASGTSSKSTNGPTAGDASQPAAKSAATTSTSKSEPAVTTKTSTTPGSTDTSADAGAPKTSTAAAATGKSHKKKGHGSSTATAKTDATEAKAPANEAATAAKASATGPAAASAAPGVSGQAGVATTGKGKHRHHGAATPAVPQPAVVVNPVAVTPPSTPPPVTPPPAPALSETAPPASDVPKIETGLPVPRPGAGTTASLPLAMVRSATPDVKIPFSFSDYPSRKHTQTYPWKNGIVTTVFWIGEGSTPLSGMTNLKSAWDGNWVHNNGGADDQYDMSGYGSGSHASTLNPFYIALPFNDLAYPDKTSRWLPDNWSKPQHRGDKPMSACQHRWIEIKNRAGRVCFAQWEDVGPIVTDDAEYVFGPSRPSASRGLDVSPAVAKYLGIDSTAITSWRFVDDEDVLPGMWLRYDEQALLFRAMKEKLRGGGANTRIQQLEEPTPDDADNDANQKKVGNARG